MAEILFFLLLLEAVQYAVKKNKVKTAACELVKTRPSFTEHNRSSVIGNAARPGFRSCFLRQGCLSGSGKRSARRPLLQPAALINAAARSPRPIIAAEPHTTRRRGPGRMSERDTKQAAMFIVFARLRRRCDTCAATHVVYFYLFSLSLSSRHSVKTEVRVWLQGTKQCY